MIKISKEIYTVLNDNEELNALVDGRIFPIASAIDTKFPFILFSRDTYIPSYVKDGISTKTATITIMVMSNDYANSIDVADAVNKAMITHSRRWKLIEVNEDYSENDKTSVFLQILKYTINK